MLPRARASEEPASRRAEKKAETTVWERTNPAAATAPNRQLFSSGNTSPDCREHVSPALALALALQHVLD